MASTSPSRKCAVEIDKLRKVYDKIVAVDDVSFKVSDVEIFGMVGPNAAGKTTTIVCVHRISIQ